MFRAISISLAVFAASASIANAQSLEPLPRIQNAATDEMIDLGRTLFFEARLSGDGSTACADCHMPEFGFGDGSEISRGYPSSRHWRNSQTLVNSAYLEGGMHWDGTVPSLVEQVAGAMGTPFAANIDVMMAEERLRQIPGYVSQFQSIWGEDPNIARISEAIAAYERTLVSIDSPYDRFVAGDSSAMSSEATRGWGLFNGKAGCNACHSGALFTDQGFHNISVPANPEFLEDPLIQITFRRSMRGFGVDPDVYMSVDRDPGYYAVTKNTGDLGAFRTPPLRYLKYTAPYMHNGMLYTLDEVVDFYNQGGTEDKFGSKSELIKPLGLTQREKSDLIAFLESLSGTEITEQQPELPGYEILALGGNLPDVAPDAGPAKPSQGLELVPAQSGVSASGSGLFVTSKADGLTVVQADAKERVVIVAPGETLGDIAKREYGDVLKFMDIINANADVLTDPNNVVPGTRLIMP